MLFLITPVTGYFKCLTLKAAVCLYSALCSTHSAAGSSYGVKSTDCDQLTTTTLLLLFLCRESKVGKTPTRCVRGQKWPLPV